MIKGLHDHDSLIDLILILYVLTYLLCRVIGISLSYVFVFDLGLIHKSNYTVINEMTKLKGKSLNESDHAYVGYVEIRVYDE